MYGEKMKVKLQHKCQQLVTLPCYLKILKAYSHLHVIRTEYITTGKNELLLK